MGRPSKSATAIITERRSHRTKSEIEYRRKQEKSFLSNKKIIESAEVKNNQTAHKKFVEITGLLKKIELNDALIGNPINRYCLLYSECFDLEKNIAENKILKIKLQEKCESEEIEFLEYIALLSNLEKSFFKYDSLLMARRDMMLKIERESLMTVASKLRAIPKNPKNNKDEESDSMNMFLLKKGGGSYGG